MELDYSEFTLVQVFTACCFLITGLFYFCCKIKDYKYKLIGLGFLYLGLDDSLLLHECYYEVFSIPQIDKSTDFDYIILIYCFIGLVFLSKFKKVFLNSKIDIILVCAVLIWIIISVVADYFSGYRNIEELSELIASLLLLIQSIKNSNSFSLKNSILYVFIASFCVAIVFNTAQNVCPDVYETLKYEVLIKKGVSIKESIRLR